MVDHRLGAFAALLLLAGCGSPAEQAATPADPGTNIAEEPGTADRWLVGAWVEDEAACTGGDTAIVFDADGGFTAYERSGSWSFSGRTLTMTTLATYEMGGPDGERHVESPVPRQAEVLSHDEKHANLRWDDGGEQQLVRCADR